MCFGSWLGFWKVQSQDKYLSLVSELKCVQEQQFPHRSGSGSSPGRLTMHRETLTCSLSSLAAEAGTPGLGWSKGAFSNCSNYCL